MKLGYRKKKSILLYLIIFTMLSAHVMLLHSTIRMLWLFPCSSFSIRGKRFVDFCHWYCIPPINPDLDSVWRQSSTLFSILNTLMWRSVYFNRKFRKSKPSPYALGECYNKQKYRKESFAPQAWCRKDKEISA